MLALALAPGLMAGVWLLVGGRRLVPRADALTEVARLAGVRPAGPRAERAVRLTGVSTVAGTGLARRRGGLGAKLVEDGMPRSPLNRVDLAGQLPASPVPAAPEARPGAQPVPAPGAGQRAAARGRAAAGAAELLPAEFAPRRRRIPAPAGSGREIEKVLRPPERVPRLSTGLGAPGPAGAEPPGVERGPQVPPPQRAKRLPAPRFGLELGD
jgi:hypothetical protein